MCLRFYLSRIYFINIRGEQALPSFRKTSCMSSRFIAHMPKLYDVTIYNYGYFITNVNGLINIMHSFIYKIY